MKKDKDQLQQELQIVQGDAYREQAPSRVPNKNKKLRSLKSKLVHLEAKYNSFVERIRNRKKDGMPNILNFVINYYEEQINKVKEEIEKLESL